MSIEHSMHDLDSAVGKLDNILMTLYVIIAVLIIAVALVTHSFLRSSVWLVHLYFSSSGSSVDYNRYWCWNLDSRFVSSFCGIIVIKPPAFFRVKLADWWKSDRSPNQYYLLAH